MKIISLQAAGPGQTHHRKPVLRWLAGLLMLVAVAPLLAAPRPLPSARGFELIALGVNGGLTDGDLSAWLLRAAGDRHYLGLDAGTVLPGIAAGLRQHAFDDFMATPGSALTRQGQIFTDGISGWFISHPHLDHVAGLLIASTDDTAKPVYGLPQTLDALSRNYFNWSAWPNFADRGPAPALGRYRFQPHVPGELFPLQGTQLQGQLFELKHDRMISSMLLLHEGMAWFAYFGDTGPDQVQGSHCLADIWTALAPLIRQRQLSGMVIEVSYPDGIDDQHLYGHLTPAWLLTELHRLAAAVGGRQPLAGLTVVIGHIKPSLRAGHDPRQLIERQLRQGNDLGVRFVLPRQGQRLWLPAPPAAHQA
ncbi:MBL fold metallo-hydrolase [Frateuria aurantia]